MKAEAFLYPFLCFTGTLVVLSLLPLYIRARNWPVIYNVLLLSLSAFAFGVNSILWFDNSTVKAAWWCEICKHIVLSHQRFILTPDHFE